MKSVLHKNLGWETNQVPEKNYEKVSQKSSNINLHKDYSGDHLDFYKLILFYRVLSELSDIFNHLKKFKVIKRAIKVGDLNKFLMEGTN